MATSENSQKQDVQSQYIKNLVSSSTFEKFYLQHFAIGEYVQFSKAICTVTVQSKFESSLTFEKLYLQHFAIGENSQKLNVHSSYIVNLVSLPTFEKQYLQYFAITEISQK